MKIAFLSWWWPYPANNGAKIRVYNLIRHLAATHEVTLLSFAETDEATPDQIAHLQSFCETVVPVPKPTYHPNSVKATLGYFSKWPRSLIDTYSETMAERVQQYAASVDLLIASQLQTLRYLECVPQVPAILEEMEVTGFYERVEQANGASSRMRAQMTVTKLESTLRRLFERGVAMTVVSEAEREFLASIAPLGAHISVIPNGVDTKINQPDETPPVPNTLIYPGAVTYSANYDAVKWFVGEVLPLVRQRVPDVSFTVTGGTGGVNIRKLAAQPGVRFTGYLPEIAPAIRASWATVVPLRQGGGTRLKILESMALGTPVIATHKGAEGLKIHSGGDILIADEPQVMADSICALLADPTLRARLAAGARARVETEYDWTIIGQNLLELVNQQGAAIHG
ncbi:MAG: glycosyl transferase family 1 [Anaerolineaceae bacterium]|nr:glycosyl transferase family 1 [Anaerolineaceae bacterium]